jgi:hypothetical protein
MSNARVACFCRRPRPRRMFKCNVVRRYHERLACCRLTPGSPYSCVSPSFLSRARSASSAARERPGARLPVRRLRRPERGGEAPPRRQCAIEHSMLQYRALGQYEQAFGTSSAPQNTQRSPSRRISSSRSLSRSISSSRATASAWPCAAASVRYLRARNSRGGTSRRARTAPRRSGTST